MKYLILAAGDISKSQQNTKLETGNHRNITVETDETSEPIWNRMTTGSNGCIKFILKQIEPPVEELVTAFEFEGSVVKKSGLDANSLVGCCLIVTNPDICRGILLLKSSECQIIRATTTNSNNNNIHSNNTYNNNAHTNNTPATVTDITGDMDGLGDELIEQLLDDDFSFIN